MTGTTYLGPPAGERRTYKHAPIEEALCEVRFQPSQDYDPTIPGLVYQQLKAEYPAKPRTQNVMEAGVQNLGQDADSPSIFLRHNSNRVQFRSDDELRLASIGVDVVSAHILRPYTDWEHFREQIGRLLRAYRETSAPDGIVRIGLRYINKIILDADVVDLNEYFTSPPDQPPSLPQTLKSFITRLEASYDDSEIRLVTTLASTGADDGKSAFILDVDVIGEYDPPLPLEEAESTIDDLRDRERVAFESLITDQTRMVFDAD